MEENERKPFLSESDAMNLAHSNGDPSHGFLSVRAIILNVRNFYEAKITSGELIPKADHERIVREAEDRARSERWGRRPGTTPR